MTTTEIYELEPVTDNPMFEGLASVGVPSLLGGEREDLSDDFFPVDSNHWDWAPETLTDIWKTPTLSGRVTAFNDFPCLDMMTPAFSERAVAALGDVLRPNGELLQLHHEIGTFYAFNCTRIVEIIDQENTDAMWGPAASGPKCASSVNHFSIHEGRLQELGELSIFRMRELCNRVYVTDRFVEAVQEAGLNGFHFVKVWPFPKGVDYFQEEALRRRREGQKVTTPDGPKEVKAESMVIEFDLSETKMTKEERKQLSRFEDELDAQLIVKRMDGLYYGSLEGRRTKKGVTRLFLSCPDANALLKKLTPWLKALDWQSSPRVLLRSAPYDDADCEERLVESL